MSKHIKLTPEDIEAYVQEFKSDLTKSKWADGKVNFSKTLGTISRKATVRFTEGAWLKMQTLIREFDKEVAWHGTAFRGDDTSKDEYYITDILVYPQKVTGASVEMDTEEYAKWIEENIEDERFFDIRMQGHSHVNMGVSPSSVDLTHQEAILDQLSDGLFYIFMIWNKKGDGNIKIYDLAKNVLFEKDDIEVEVMDDGYGLDAFIKDAKNMVKDRVYVGGYQSSKYYKGSVQSSSQPSSDKDEKKKNITSHKSEKRKGIKKSADYESGMDYFKGQGYDPTDPFGYYGR